jgi:C1A family cysteine protease
MHLNEHQLSYATKEEYNFRFNVFQKNDEKIHKINSENVNFEVDHNKFSTYTHDEFKAFTGGNAVSHIKKNSTNNFGMPENYILTQEETSALEEARAIDQMTESQLEALEDGDSFDWREQGAVNPVKDSGNTCANSGAFSATDVMETAYMKQWKSLPTLSV